MKRIFLAVIVAVWAFGQPLSFGRGAKLTKMLVLNPEGKLAERRLTRLGKDLRQLVAKYPSIWLVGGKKIINNLFRIRARCRNTKPACLAAMGRVAKADQVLYTAITPLPGRWLVTMTLVDVASARVLERARQHSRRSMVELRNAMWKAWVQLRGPLLRSQLKVSANVSGAKVFLDGREVGRTPLVLTKRMERGRHVIKVVADGYEPASRVIKVKGGEGITVNVNLQRAKTSATGKEAKPGKRRENLPLPAEVKGEKMVDSAKSRKPQERKVAQRTLAVEKKVQKKTEEKRAGDKVRPDATKSATADERSKAQAEKPSKVTLAVRPPLTGPQMAKGEPAEKGKEIGDGEKKAGKEHAKTLVARHERDGLTEKPPAVDSTPLQMPSKPTKRSSTAAWYESWWFWTAVGAAVLGGTAAGLAVGLSGGDGIPAGKGRVTLEF